MNMKTNYVLIDYENVAVKSLALLKGHNFRVYVFLGPKNTKINADLAMAMQELGNKAEYIKLDASGHNALDFHITYYLGKLAATDAIGKFCIISKDTGFDSLIKHIKEKNIDCSRAVSIEAMLGIKEKPVAKVSATKPAKTEKLPVSVKAPKKLDTSALVKKVVDSLVRRKIAVPRTEKTMKNLVKSLCGTQYSEEEVGEVYSKLLNDGIVIIDGKKVSYKLPD